MASLAQSAEVQDEQYVSMRDLITEYAIRARTVLTSKRDANTTFFSNATVPMMSVALAVLLAFAALSAQHSDAQSLPAFSVSDSELAAAAHRMREGDANRAKPGQIVLNYQDHTNSRDTVDNAPENFFKHVDPTLLSRPTFAALIALFGDYNRDAGVAEPRVSSATEKKNIDNFMDAVAATEPYKILFNFLNKNGHPFATNEQTLRKNLKHIWFDRYSRARGVLDSSGFEHVFVGEAKNGEVSGLHNWIRYYTLEKDAKGGVNYMGFVLKRGSNLASIKFSWEKEIKPNGSFLIGTSPEYDFSVLSLCFLSRREREECRLEIDGCPFSVTSFDLQQKGDVFIGTSYPTAGASALACRA